MIGIILILSLVLFLYSFFSQYNKYNYLVFAHVGLISYFFFILYYSAPLIFNIYFYDLYVDGYRVKELDISFEENFELSKHILVGSFSFALVFIFQSKSKKKKINLNINYPDYIYFLFFLLICFYLLKLLFNPDFETTSRLSAYKFAQTLNQTEAQLLKFINVTLLLLEIIFYFEFCKKFRNKKKIIYLFLIFILIFNFWNVSLFSNRSEFFMKLFIIIIAFNLYVRKLNLYLISILAISIFSLLIVWGNIRETHIDSDTFVIKSLGEFDMIFSNFFDVLRNGPYNINSKIKFLDFYSFIPGQFLPFEKIHLSHWFMTNFHNKYYTAGGGYGFGILAESIVGWGLLETFVKIFFLSFFLNKFFIKFLNRQNMIYQTFYILLIIKCPLSIRISTFYFINDVIQFSIIFIIFISIFILLHIPNHSQNLKNEK